MNYSVLSRDELIQELEALQRRFSQPEVADNEPLRLLCQLQIHQIRLEMQDRELQEIQYTLREARDHYTTLYNFAPVGYLKLDVAGVICDLNLAAAVLLGRERTQLLNTEFAFFLAADERMVFLAYLLQTFTSARRSTYETQLLLPGLATGVCDIRLDSVVVDDFIGQRIFLMNMMDISEQRRVERQLQTLHAQMKTLLTAVPVGVSLIQNYVFQWLNPAFLQLLDYLEHELVGQSLAHLFPSQEAFTLHQQQQREQIRADGCSEMQARLRRKNGSWVEVMLICASLDRQNPVAGKILIAADRTQYSEAIDSHP